MKYFLKYNLILFIIIINQFSHLFAFNLNNSTSLIVINQWHEIDLVLPVDNRSESESTTNQIDATYPFLLLNSTPSLLNHTNFDPINSNDTESHLLRNIFLSMIFIPIILSTLIGNMLVILAVVIVRKLHTQDNANNYLIVSLAVSDFLVGVLAMPFAFYTELSQDNKWYLGAILCDLWTLSDVLLCSASILNLCAISVDRYFIILHAMVYTQRRNSKLMLFMILIVWLLSALISIPPLFGWGKPSSRLGIDKMCAVSSELLYQIFATFLSFFLPLFIMIIIYITIYRAARKIKKREMETAGRLQFPRPSLSFSPDSIVNIKSHMEPLINIQHCETQQCINNLAFNNKNSDYSASSLITNNCVTKTQSQQQQVIVSVKKSSSDSEQVSTESKIYHSSMSSQENVSSLNNNKEHRLSSSILNPIMMVVSSSITHHGGSHVTVNAINGSRRSSIGRKFGRRLTQAFAGFKRNSGLISSHGKNQKATRTLGVIMGCFILCWLPFFILAVVKPISLNNGYSIGDYIPKWLDSLLLWLGYINSALNPMIYARFNREFRRPFIEILCFRCRGINDKLRDEERKKMYMDSSHFHHSFTQPPANNFNHNRLSPNNISGLLSPNFTAKSSSQEKSENAIFLSVNGQTKIDENCEINLSEEEVYPALDLDHKKQIELEKNKFFFGTNKAPYEAGINDTNQNLDENNNNFLIRDLTVLDVLEVSRLDENSILKIESFQIEEEEEETTKLLNKIPNEQSQSPNESFKSDFSTPQFLSPIGSPTETRQSDASQTLENNSSDFLETNKLDYYESTSSIFQQVESVLASSSSSNSKSVDNSLIFDKSSSLCSNRKNATNVNKKPMNFLIQKLKNKKKSIDTFIPFSSVYSFYTTAPTSPVNLIDTNESDLDSANTNNNLNSSETDLNNKTTKSETSRQRKLLNNNNHPSLQIQNSDDQLNEANNLHSSSTNTSNGVNHKANSQQNSVPLAYCTYNKVRRASPPKQYLVSNLGISNKNSPPNTLQVSKIDCKHSLEKAEGSTENEIETNFNSNNLCTISNESNNLKINHKSLSASETSV